MRKEIHPKYSTCQVSCACGNRFETRSVKPEIKCDICNVCHPFFSGKIKLIDTEGRVDRFKKKYSRTSAR
jgi:large subunit ribosomal protein L31